MTSNQRQRCDIQERHFLIPIGIALRKRTGVAQSGIIDQEIDFEFLAIKRLQEILQLTEITQISFSNVNNKLRMLSLQLISQLDQSFVTSSNQDHRAGTTGELPGEFTTDARRSTCD